MTNHQILNNVDHRDLRVALQPGATLGDAQMCTLAMPSEFRTIQAEYPILFLHDENTGLYQPMALFGLEKDENLFLAGDSWQARYQPLMMQRGPFLIGFQELPDAPGEKQMVVTIDMEHPRVGAADGEPLFDPFGGSSAYVERIGSVLREIDEGQAAIRELSSVLEQHELLEPLTLNAQLRNGEKLTLAGFHAIHEERLSQVAGYELADWSRRGLLQAMYMSIASMENLGRLLEMKNNRL